MSPSTSTDGSAAVGLERLPHSPRTHFKLAFLGAVLHVLEQLAQNFGSVDEVIEQFPFVRGYLDELEALGAPPAAGATDWMAAVGDWAARADTHLPLAALRLALDLDDRSLTLLLAIGLIEEDPRFGFLIECAQPVSPQQYRPTLGLLTAWWRDAEDVSAVRARIRALLDNGLIQVLNPDAARLQWVFHSPPAVWDALRGDVNPQPTPWLTYSAAGEAGIGDLVLEEGVARAVAAIPSLVRFGALRALIVRGPQHNGRRTIVRAIARALGRGVLELRAPLPALEERWPLVGALATLANAVPVVVFDLSLGETSELPALRGFRGLLAVVLGKHGAVCGPAVDGAVTIMTGIPSASRRRALWRESLPATALGDADELAGRFRMTSGNISSGAALARSYALLDGRARITAADVRVACRSMHRELETLATLVPAAGGWHHLGAPAETLDELRNLERRCRQREQLCGQGGARTGGPVNCGVRALFAGPSGTGKTLAASILAATLEMDLYRLDLAAVVNKFIGETERSLHQLFSRAEELDVVLLIDEGDALLTSRTAVQSSNDRYANLETNFLLQRLESFEGVLVVTTNAANRIDAAFQRRMDVVVEFCLPDAHERFTIWQLHLPAGNEIDGRWLEGVAIRCELSGGQIRNAVLHASLLALDQGRPVAPSDLESAVRREYRKGGGVCPLPPAAGPGA